MSQETVRLLLLDENQTRRQELYSRLANFTDISLEAPEQAIDPTVFFVNDASQVVLLDRDYLGDGYGFGTALLETFPDKAVLLLDSEPDLAKMRQAVIGGFSDVISSDMTNEELVEVIVRSRRSKKQNLELLREDKTKKTLQTYGKVISVFSTKGGVGRTFTAINLAVLLKQSADRVALLDLDTEYGTAALAMGLQAKTTINDVLGDLRNLDGDLLESYMLSHESGVKVLAAAGEPQIENYINAEQIEIILRTLQDNFDYVVVDMPGRFMEMISPALMLSSHLLMITTPEILALNNVKAGLSLLKDLNYPTARLKVVLNRYQRKGLSKSDVEKSLDGNVFMTIPDDGAVLNSLNLGTPFVLSNPRSKTTKALRILLDSFTSEK